ncbi:MAG: PorT family protein [Chitinophagales bacterium]|nr:PorT family protein [Chitinophagales bacterium]
MRKVVFSALWLSLFAVAAHGQLGVNGGLNISSMRGSEIQNSKSKASMHLGVFYQVPLFGDFALQPEASYSGEGSKSGTGSSDKIYKLNYLNFCLLFRYNFEKGISLATGPQFGSLLNAKLKFGNNTTDLKNEIRKANNSWAITAAYDLLSGLGFYGRYNIGISDIEKDSQRGSLKASTFQLGVRYTLSMGGED